MHSAMRKMLGPERSVLHVELQILSVFSSGTMTAESELAVHELSYCITH